MGHRFLLTHIFGYKTTYVVLICVVFGLLIPLLPFQDDLYYISPVSLFDPAGLLPGLSYWRPFDYLFRVLLGFIPVAYPLLNHLVVVIGHIGSIYLIHRILVKQLGLNEKDVFFPCLFFLIVPAVFVAVASIDSLNQVWSAFFGLLAVSLLVSRPCPRQFALALLCCIASVFWKESGIVFFIAAPLLAFLLRYAVQGTTEIKPEMLTIKRLLIYLVIGLAFCLLYFGLRFLLTGSLTLGEDSGRYALSLSPISVLRNALLLFAINFSALDSIALFLQPRNIALLIITGVLSLPLIGWVIKQCIDWCRFAKPRKESLIESQAEYSRTQQTELQSKPSAKPLQQSCPKPWLFLLGLFIIALICISPYLVMSRPGEMHAYQLTPFVVILLAFLSSKPTTHKDPLASTEASKAVLLSSKLTTRKNPLAATRTPQNILIVVFCLFFTASLVSNAHKWVCMKQIGESTRPVYEAIVNSYPEGEHPTRVLAIAVETSDEPLYSVFKLTVSDSSWAGLVAASHWAWRYPEVFEHVTITEDIPVEAILARYQQKLAWYDSVWIVWPDGETIVLRRGVDY